MYTRENYTSTLYRAKILVFCDKYRKKPYIKAYKTKRIHMHTRSPVLKKNDSFRQHTSQTFTLRNVYVLQT